MAISDSIRALAILGDEGLSNVKSFLEGHGFELPADGIRARAWCLAQATAGDVQACYVAAEMFHFGLFGPIDQHRALELCQVAANAGLMPAALLLASITENQDERRASVIMEQSAQKGYAPAMYASALKYLVDGPNQSDKEVGLRYLRQAASHSYAAAQATLATHLLESGREDEIREGIELMQKAAEHGSAHAHRMLGYYFQGGRYGLEKDAAKAAQFRAQAEQMESEALRPWGLE